MIPSRYPIEPPKIRFVTPIFHPNIDNAGRICLDSLKMPPKGAWVPSLNISTLLTTIRLLMAEPNADDGLMPDIVRPLIFALFCVYVCVISRQDHFYFYLFDGQTQLYKTDMRTFIEKAKEHTLKNATRKTEAPTQTNTTAGGTAAVKLSDDESDSSSEDSSESSSGSSSSGSESESDEDELEYKKNKRPLLTNSTLENEATTSSEQQPPTKKRLLPHDGLLMKSDTNTKNIME